ncbi:MAG: S1 family peptidase [Burkholderiaceae bacterium]|nr:S1 family peptidase [Burkholderiaceae bacterium]
MIQNPRCKNSGLAILGLVSTLCTVPACAESAPNLDLTPLLTTSLDPSNYVVSSSTVFDGVARLRINSNRGCSGALVGGGSYILTAAHCVANQSITATSVSATFSAASGSPTVSVLSAQSSIFLPPGWTGDFKDGADLALIKLDSPVLDISSYDIVSTGLGLPSMVTLAGYGRPGTGSTGSSAGFGTLRVGTNTYDGEWDSRIVGGSPYMFDFDDGSLIRNVTGGPTPTQRGGIVSESMIASGDSGGPSFIELAGGQLALVGVHSFGGTVGQPEDLDDILNASFGELGGDSNVPLYANWINSHIAVIPEPQTYTLLMFGVLFVVAVNAKRKGRRMASLTC